MKLYIPPKKNSYCVIMKLNTPKNSYCVIMKLHTPKKSYCVIMKLRAPTIMKLHIPPKKLLPCNYETAYTQKLSLCNCEITYRLRLQTIALGNETTTTHIRTVTNKQKDRHQIVQAKADVHHVETFVCEQPTPKKVSLRDWETAKLMLHWNGKQRMLKAKRLDVLHVGLGWEKRGRYIARELGKQGRRERERMRG